MDEREEKLGFKPQKEIVYNKLLPYNDDIDEESQSVLAEIKSNLGRSVQLRDLKFGTGHWVGQLSRYIRLYGLKFSKEDHIHFIKLLFELIIIPDLEVSLVQKFANQLAQLLKKRELLTREDLELPWRPLYKLVESIMYSQNEQNNLVLFPRNIESTLNNLVRCCRPYFPLESTKEMMEEWRPLLCPFDITVVQGLRYIEMFMNVQLPPEQMDQGFRVWFQELIGMWESFQTNPSWESFLVKLMARLANNNIGYIDWSPYLPRVFNKLLRIFDLPVGTQSIQVGQSNNRNDIEPYITWVVAMMVFNKLLRIFDLPVGTQSIQVGQSNNRNDIEPYITWVVAMMGGGSDTQTYIDKMFKLLQTFYHPSNLGKWNIKLSSLLMTFPRVFINRLKRERYEKPKWYHHTLDSHKLTDSDVTKFVESMKETVFLSMFSKYGSQDSAVALRHLSNMRPELVVPPLLEKMYPAMETLIEPHRLIACMNCVVSVVRPMLSAGKWYPEGKLHILPLLTLALPGIDSNDFKKCLVTFQMISTFVSLIPIVDCSEAIHVRTDMTETETELCSATAQFEDFVLQFIDRILNLIEKSAQEQVHGNQERLNPEQTMVEIGLASTFTSVLQQCSAPIYTSALRRLHNFIVTSVYESKVGGRFAANLVRAAVKAKPEQALKMFMDKICDELLQHIKSHEDVLSSENLDDGFLWNMLMFAQLVRCDGGKLLPYKDKLLEIFPTIMKLQCVQGYEIAGQAIRFVLRALTSLYPTSFKSIAGSFDRPVSEYLAIRDWAIPGDIDNLGIEWHIPTDEEITFTQELFDKLLLPELEAINAVSAENTMQREELLRRLNNILECLNGAGAVLPMWEGKQLSFIECQVPMSRFTCGKACGTHSEVTIQNGKNVREAVTEAIRPLLSYMSSTCEDDTKGFFKLLKIYETVLFFTGIPKTDFENRWKSFHAVKKALEDKMRTGKKHIRALMVDRVFLQHEMRSLQKNSRVFTEKHNELLQDLFTLSISRYSEVRKRAQSVLFQNFHNYPYSYRAVLDQLVSKLKDKDIPEHEFQGCLYVLQGSNKRSIPTKRSWEVITQVWPAIVQSQNTEKPTILGTIENIVSSIVKFVETTAIKTLVNEASLTAARQLLEGGTPPPKHPACTPAELKQGQESEQARNNHNQNMYESLVTELVQLINDGNLTWKFCHIGLLFLSCLVRCDTPLPACAIDLTVKTLVHDSLTLRKVAQNIISSVLKQQKRKHKVVEINPYKQGGQSGGAGALQPGFRSDNQWHIYDSSNFPDTQEKWENLVVVEKTHWGYYTWPKALKIYAPHTEQPPINRDRNQLTEGEQLIYDAFTNQEFVDKLIDFLSLEENKGKDKFEAKKMALFKGLFRNYGDCVSVHIKSHIDRLVKDVSFDKHDSSQRCAMEMLSGLLRGSKHWTYQQTKSLWDWAIPLMKNALNNLTVQTHDDWSNFFTIVSESRDPRKIYWYFEMLMDNPLSGEGGSFGDAGRLHMLQHAMIQQEWRVCDMVKRLVAYLTPHLGHQYKNVRDRIGSALSNVFILDYSMFRHFDTRSPTKRAFIESVLPKLERLQDILIEEAKTQNDGDTSSVPLSEGVEKMEVENHHEESEEKKALIRLCKTVLKCVANCIKGTFDTASAEFFHLLPIICTLQSESKDEELKADCDRALGFMSQALLHSEVIPVALSAIKTIVGSPSWHARSAVLEYIQVMVFFNFFSLDTPQHKTRIRETVMHLICDEKLERKRSMFENPWDAQSINQDMYVVRDMASITLSGLLQCGYLEMDTDMLDHFEKLTSTKIKKKNKSDVIPVEKIIQRHAGVLGLSAFVQAYPYNVPDWMPQILMTLSNHVNDPQPIQLTVKKTLSNFRRTHHDNWHDHKLRFTDDQLVILTDLLVSPNYYA